MKKLKARKKAVIALLVAGLVIALISIAGYLLWPKPILPQAVTKQATFTVYVPSSQEVKIAPDTAKYDKDLKLLSYNVSINGINSVMSMQPVPESFTDIPQYYDKVVAKMNEYTKFESINGTVYLTRPTDMGGKQLAVMNTKGTLLFVRPDNDLTDDQWRLFFKNIDTLD